jgi:hypothetical protein
VVIGDAILEVLNNDVIFAGNRRIKQTPLKVLHLLMQNSPCPDEVMQSLETSFRFSALLHPELDFKNLSANLRNLWWGGARKRINQKGSEPGNAITSGNSS